MVVLIAVSPLSFAGGKHHHKAMVKAERNILLAAALNLSEAQVSEIKEIKKRHKETFKAAFPKEKAVRIKALDTAATDYEANVSAALEANMARDKARFLTMAKVKAESYAVLTADQQQKFDVLMAQVKEAKKEAKEAKNKVKEK